ncbi:exodeoxyribonuclease VII large subunit [Candidatus Saccharibacteria bacterium]|nr:exodeoxyribonuclease VII large subunit [Candidatus Saccharibacteria bacterium]
MDEVLKLSPSEFIAVVNQTLDYAYDNVVLEGEVASFKVNQGKWVFFDVKDEVSSVSCFMSLYQLRMPLEDGMKVEVLGAPKITKWGKFSFTVRAVRPVGEGSLKKAYELLKKKLAFEGLFDNSRKREIPDKLNKIGVISSTAAAGYADFIKILNARWGGMKVEVAHTQVQGIEAPDQIIKAINYFNERSDVQVIAILRGGGSADDLSAFNDEKLVRAIAGSRIPIITGVGHEVDESLADLAADVRASTPSNAAEMLTGDRKVEMDRIESMVDKLNWALRQKVEVEEQKNLEKVERIAKGLLQKYIEPSLKANEEKMQRALQKILNDYDKMQSTLAQKIRLVEALNPEMVLSQGYAILAGKISPGSMIEITTHKQNISAEVKEIHERK